VGEVVSNIRNLIKNSSNMKIYIKNAYFRRGGGADKFYHNENTDFLKTGLLRPKILEVYNH